MIKVVFGFGIGLRYGDSFRAVARQNAVFDRRVKNLPKPFIDLVDLLIESSVFACLSIGLKNEGRCEFRKLYVGEELHDMTDIELFPLSRSWGLVASLAQGKPIKKVSMQMLFLFIGNSFRFELRSVFLELGPCFPFGIAVESSARCI